MYYSICWNCGFEKNWYFIMGLNNFIEPEFQCDRCKEINITGQRVMTWNGIKIVTFGDLSDTSYGDY